MGGESRDERRVGGGGLFGQRFGIGGQLGGGKRICTTHAKVSPVWRAVREGGPYLDGGLDGGIKQLGPRRPGQTHASGRRKTDQRPQSARTKSRGHRNPPPHSASSPQLVVACFVLRLLLIVHAVLAASHPGGQFDRLRRRRRARNLGTRPLGFHLEAGWLYVAPELTAQATCPASVAKISRGAATSKTTSTHSIMPPFINARQLLVEASFSVA